MKNVFISGIEGNMGSRYAILCRMLGLNVLGADRNNFTDQAIFCNKNKIDGIIVATPTHTHIDAINIFANQTGLPLLVEKPIRRGTVKTLAAYNVTMVNQYKYLADKDSIGLTYYNYFKTGGDGLLWDCINIIGLAKGEVRIKKESAFWRCMINGKRLHIKDMDRAYFEMIKDWTENPVGNGDYIEEAHDRVHKMAKSRYLPKNAKERNEVKAKSQVIPIIGKAND